MTAMEYIRGIDVIHLLKVKGKLSEKLVRVIISQVGLALIHLHLKGFIHRDVKVFFPFTLCMRESTFLSSKANFSSHKPYLAAVEHDDHCWMPREID